MTEMSFGKYRIVEKIGAGGFGEVFKGFDPMLNRFVAIKTCLSDEDELRRRFLREAEIAARLQHPNIVTVFDFGYHDDSPYLVQEYLSGEDLDHKIKRRDPLSLRTKLEYLAKIAAGLCYAHTHEVIHRDVKPANVRVLDDGQVRVMDFGIAKLMTAETQLTRTGMALGTAAYLPPEQLLGQRLDPRADQFSFGVLAYELLTWERPFGGDSLSTVLYAIAHQDPVPITSRWPACPPRLATVIGTCLAKEPSGRYAGLAEVITELEAIAAASAVVPLAAAVPAPASTSLPPVPPVPPDLAETVAIGDRATAQTAARQDRGKTGGGGRKRLLAIIVVAVMVMALGLMAVLLFKRVAGGKKPRLAAATTTTTATPATTLATTPATTLATTIAEPALDALASDEAGQEVPAELLEEPAELAAGSRDTDPLVERPKPASVPRPRSGTSATTPSAEAPAAEAPNTTTPAAPASADAEATGPGVPGPGVLGPAEQAALIVSKSYGLELGRLVPGLRIYIDRDFVYSEVPEQYRGLLCLKTPNDLGREASALTFTVARPVEVFVAHDQRVTKKPAWLGSFRATGQVLKVAEGGRKQTVTTYDIYVRSYAAGAVKLGSSAPSKQRRKHRISMYSIFLRPLPPGS